MLTCSNLRSAISWGSACTANSAQKRDSEAEVGVVMLRMLTTRLGC
jgi:hypothetical protein